jgi:RES domain
VKAIACSECFHDQGLRFDAQRLGVTDSTACPNCGATIGRKLNSDRLAGNGRLDSPGFPVMYASPDLEVCVHECRVTREDDLYVATLGAVSSLRGSISLCS